MIHRPVNNSKDDGTFAYYTIYMVIDVSGTPEWTN